LTLVLALQGTVEVYEVTQACHSLSVPAISRSGATPSSIKSRARLDARTEADRLYPFIPRGEIMSDMNLYALQKNFDANSLGQLAALANSAEGPLRITIEHDVPHIGVRSWPTYFFEKITCAFNLNSLENIEKQTIKSIKKHVGPSLKTFSKNSSDLLPHMLLHKLCTRTSEASLNPDLGPRLLLNASTTRPEYVEPVVVRDAKFKVIDGMMIVPKGLSMISREIGKVMADCHLVTITDTNAIPNSAGTAIDSDLNYAVPKKILPTLVQMGKSPCEKDFYEFYYNGLISNTDSIQTCVAIELLSTEMENSLSNRNGALRAASAFMKQSKLSGKSISVSLCIKQKLQEVIETLHPVAPNSYFDKPGPFLEFSTLQSGVQKSENFSDSETERSEDENYFEDKKTNGNYSEGDFEETDDFDQPPSDDESEIES
jgi:hypothetical protein